MWLEWLGGTTIYGFSESDIWVAGGGIFHYNGIKWTGVEDTDPVLHNNTPYTSLWGTSSSNLYLGSEGGKIIHWDGIKAEVVLDLGIWIRDINGTGVNNIWATAVKSSDFIDIILHYNGFNWEQVQLPTGFAFLRSVMPFNDQEAIVGGNGMYYRLTNGGWEDLRFVVLGSIQRIRGNTASDVFAVGGYGTVTHYNGIDLHFYDELYTPSGGINYGVYTTGNKVFIVGTNEDNTKSKIIIGTIY
jgi:hypothetical protein